MVIKNQHIEIITSRIDIDQMNCWSVYFKRPVGFVFKAGDWIDLQFEGRILNGGITYSISSSPTESDLRISLKKESVNLRKRFKQ